MKITMPDFEEWAEVMTGTPINKGYARSIIAPALKASFEQGRALGNREAICTTQEWWEEQDNDAAWIDANETTLEQIHREILVQVFNPKSRLYYLINKESGTVSECGSKTKHVGIRLVTSPTEG